MEILRCFPAHVRTAVTSCGAAWNAVCEIRLRAGSCSAVAYLQDGRTRMCPLPSLALTEEELREILGRLCAGSVHVYDEGLLRGYFSPLQLPGVRVGAAGRLLCQGGVPQRLQQLTSLCIRLPHTVIPGDAVRGQLLSLICGGDMPCDTPPPMDPPCDRIVSTLFYAPPGEGKTTLLRCLIHTLCSVRMTGEPLCAAVLDSGEELCGRDTADCTIDRFSGYPRGFGMELATRAFAPQLLLCDEIGSDAEAEEILRAQACGIPLIATAHADSLQTLLRRPCFARLQEHGVFARYVRLYRAAGGFAFHAETPA